GKNGRLLFRTTAAAPLGRIVQVDLADSRPSPRDLVPQGDDTIVDAAICSGRLLIHRLHDASSRLDTADLDGARRQPIELPEIGTVIALAGSWDSPNAFVNFMSFKRAPEILAIDVAACRAAASLLDSGSTIDPSRYETEQAWCTSKDGTRVSMFLIRR